METWIIGNLIGILPGAGASIACFLGYNTSRQFSHHKEEFGKGSIEGVAGSEAANNAVTGGSLIPMLTLGIPGESVTAVLMGGLIIQGLQPGPELFTRYAPMTYTFSRASCWSSSLCWASAFWAAGALRRSPAFPTPS